MYSMFSKKRTVLVIDDEPEIRLLLSLALRKHGFLIHEAKNGSEAVSVALKEKPDLILLDLTLPDIDGIQVCKTIKSKIAVPIIFLSGSSKISNIDKSYEAGANDYIVKPLKMDMLRDKIFKLLNINN